MKMVLYKKFISKQGNVRYEKQEVIDFPFVVEVYSKAAVPPLSVKLGNIDDMPVPVAREDYVRDRNSNLSVLPVYVHEVREN